MIRPYQETDCEEVLDIWVSASIKSHDFVEPDYWMSKREDMRNIYIPAAETVVYEDERDIAGFYCLLDHSLAAIFVAPDRQGRGIGSALLKDAKAKRQDLELAVYKVNAPSIRFYKKHGFAIVGDRVDEHTGQPEWIMYYQA